MCLLCQSNARIMPTEALTTTGTALTTTSTSAPSSSTGCPRCGTTKKSGKRSCCARGGAWFKKCGDVGDSTFEHTWAEGIQACKSFAVESPQAVVSRKEDINHSLSVRSAQLINTTHHNHVRTFNPDRTVSDVATTDSADCLCVTTCTSILLITTHLRSLFLRM